MPIELTFSVCMSNSVGLWLLQLELTCRLQHLENAIPYSREIAVRVARPVRSHHLDMVVRQGLPPRNGRIVRQLQRDHRRPRAVGISQSISGPASERPRAFR